LSAAFDRGARAVQRHDWREAERSFLEALKEEPDNARAMIYVLLARKRRRVHFRKRKLMHQALALAPDDAIVLRVAGSIHRIDASHRAAVTMFKRARAIDPHDADTHALLAETYLQMRKKAECEAAFTEALRLKPQNGIALGVKSDFESMYFDVAKAEQAAKIRLRGSPESTSAHLQSGHVCLAKGDVPQAYWHFREALRLSPNSDEAREAVLSALTQRFPLYSWAHRVSFRLRRYRFLGSFGTYYCLFQVTRLTYLHPEMPPALRYGILGAVTPLALLATVLILPMPLVHLAVRFHPVGRYTMTKTDKIETVFGSVVLVVGIVALALRVILRADAYEGIAAASALSLAFTLLGGTLLKHSSIRWLVLGCAMLIWISMLIAVIVSTHFFTRA